MSNTLNTVNEVVTRRITQLQKDIEEAEALLASYRSELDPLLKIAQVTGISQPVAVEPVAVEAPAPAVIEAPAPVEDDLTDVIPSRRWSRFDLPPRHLRFLDRFGAKDHITRKEISAWYKRALSPGILPESLNSNVSEITRDLMAKGILRKVDRGVWSIVR